MNLPRLAVANYRFTVVLIALFTLLGLASLFTMPRSEDPLFDIPRVIVEGIYPGARPGDIERLVLEPLEEAIGELEDLNRIRSRVFDGGTVLVITFRPGSDPDEKHRDVTRAIEHARGHLPSGMLRLRALLASSTDVSVLQFALVSETASYHELDRQAKRLERSLERLPPVKRVDRWAFPEREVRIAIRPDALIASGVPLDVVAARVSDQVAAAPAGFVDVGTRRLNVRSGWDTHSLPLLERIVVRSDEANPTYLGDLADLSFDYKEETYRARFNGRRAVFVTVAQREGTNIFNLTDQVLERFDTFGRALPADISAEVVFNQSEAVSRRIDGFFVNLLQGLVVVGVMVLLALGLRSSIIVMTVIPISLLVATGWLDMSGFGLQQISIVGMVIALGLLVDNAIVVTESINLRLDQGEPPLEAAMNGAADVGWAVTSGTATTVMALLPLVLLESDAGSFARSMPVMVIYGLVASLVISLTLTPLLCSRFLKRSASHAPTRKPWLQVALETLGDRAYVPTLRFTLNRPWTVVILATLAFLASLTLVPSVGMSLFPKAEKSIFLIDIDTPGGTSLDQTDAVAREVEGMLASNPAVLSYATNIGRGNPQIYYNVGPKEDISTHAQILVTLKSLDMREVEAAIEGIEGQLQAYPKADILVRAFEQGPPLEAPVAIKVIGEDLQRMSELAHEVEQTIASTPGTRNIVNLVGRTKLDLRVATDPDRLEALRIDRGQVDRALRALLDGLPVGDFRSAEGDVHPIVLGMARDVRPAVEEIEQLPLVSASGGTVPVSQVADIRLESGPVEFEHYNLERAATVTAYVHEGFAVSEVTSNIVGQLEARDWPPGYRYYVAGEQEGREESFGGIGRVLVIALVGIFAILVLQFGSFVQPFIIFTSIPFALTGAVGALFVTGLTFSFMAGVGLVSLVGIVVNDAILLIESANARLREGHSLDDAVYEAGHDRLQPVILTSLTTIGGLIPLTLQGGSMWAPFGWTVIGGLFFSTALILVVVPALIKIFSRKANNPNES